MCVCVCVSSCKIPVILVILESNLNFLDRFSKNPHIRNFIKIRPMGAQLFHADRGTDRHDETNSAHAQKNKHNKFYYRPVSTIHSIVMCIFSLIPSSLFFNSTINDGIFFFQNSQSDRPTLTFIQSVCNEVSTLSLIRGTQILGD